MACEGDIHVSNQFLGFPSNLVCSTCLFVRNEVSVAAVIVKNSL